KAGKVRLAVLHVLGSTVASLAEVADTTAALLDCGNHYLVKNCANDEKFEWQQGTPAAYFTAIDPAAMIEIQHLDGVARETAETSGRTFTAFVDDGEYSYTLRGYVRKWLGEVFSQFDKAGIGELAMAAPNRTRHGYVGENT